MSINGISAGYYPTAYANNKTTKAETGKSFAEIASQKSADADKEYCMDRASAALDTIGAHAPEKVRQAWMEAAEETGSNGFSITSDGKHFHGSRLLVQHIIRSHNGEADPDNILGNTIESAIRVAEKALYVINLSKQAKKTKLFKPEHIKRTPFKSRFPVDIPTLMFGFIVWILLLDNTFHTFQAVS